MYEWMDECMNGWMNRWIDGWMDGDLGFEGLGHLEVFCLEKVQSGVHGISLFRALFCLRVRKTGG